MLYRCRECERELAGGCLPTATCGLYFVFLGARSAGCLYLVVFALRAALLANVGERQQPAEPAPWWWWVVVCPVGVVLFLSVGAVVKFTLELIEWLLTRRRRCPTCGARRWSWGFTRGFGL